jgi:hypothetical protein
MRRRLHLAVAEGFEPSEGFPSRAFEARSFGRSDTPPRASLASPTTVGPIGEWTLRCLVQQPKLDSLARATAAG